MCCKCHRLTQDEDHVIMMIVITEMVGCTVVQDFPSIMIAVIIMDGSSIAQDFPSRKLSVLAHTIHTNIHTYMNIIYTHTHTHIHLSLIHI